MTKKTNNQTKQHKIKRGKKKQQQKPEKKLLEK